MTDSRLSYNDPATFPMPHSCPNCGGVMSYRGKLEAELERLVDDFSQEHDHKLVSS
jgi:Zn-finger nucleic acid-binding protein